MHPFAALMTWDGRCYVDGMAQPLEWMQYTGLNDKNDKKIFEGDILKLVHDSKREYTGQVIFNNFQYLVKTTFKIDTMTGAPVNWHILLSELSNKLGRFNHFEVIGNICENSDLIS